MAISKDKSLIVTNKKELVPLSPFKQYLIEVNKYPLLTREEEFKYAVDLYEQGDKEAANILVTSNLRLVVKIAMEYQKSYTNVLDLIQEGNIGLIKAVKKFNPYVGTKVSSYAAWWIRAYILKFLMDNKSLVKIGTTGARRRLFFNLRKEAEKLFSAENEFNTKLLAESLQVKEHEIDEMRTRVFSQDVSISSAKDLEEGSGHYDIQIPENASPSDDILIEKETKELFSSLIKKFKKTLKDKDLIIFEKRLLSDEPLTLQEIGNMYGFTRERARQLEKRIIKNFTAFLKEHGFE